MNPNEIKITNVFVRQVGELTMDDTLPWAGPNELVVQWTAGATANDNAAVDISITVAVLDYQTGLPAFPPIVLPLVGPDGVAENRTYEALATPLPPLVAAPPPYRAFEAVVWLVRPSPAPVITTTSIYRGPLFIAY